jgi:dihydrofolate reductase
MKMIAAVSRNWGIGKDGKLLFKIPADMKFFRETTSGAAVIMGRKTLDSFPNGAPLKNRINIVLTTDKNFSRDGVVVCHSKEEALLQAEKHTEVFVIGGETIYSMFLDECETAYITKVDADAEADKFIANLDELSDWRLTEALPAQNDNGYTFSFCRYEKK